MKLNDFIENLQRLQKDGHGDLRVLYRHGASGDCGPLTSAWATDKVDHSTGPFDLKPGEQYISIYAGN
jgi:hypothetical protein